MMSSGLGVSKITLFAAGLACALFFSGFLVILTPLPLLYAAAAKGREQGALAAALSFAVVAALYLFLFPSVGSEGGALAYVPAPGVGLVGFMPEGFLAVFGIGYFAFFVAIAAAIFFGAQRRASLTEWGGYALLVAIGSVFATALAAKIVCEGSLIEGLHSYVVHVLTQVTSAGGAESFENSQFIYLANNTEKVAASVVEVLPSVAFVYSLIAVALNLVLSRRFIAKSRAVRVPSALRFRLPDWAIWTLIASASAFFANSYVIHSPALGTMALNGLIGSGALYFLQGTAVTVYFLQRIRFTLIRTVAYIAIIIFLQTVSVALVVLGIADVWADFRLRHLRMQHGQ